MLIRSSIVYGCFEAQKAELSICDRDHMDCKAYNTCYPAFYKHFPTPVDILVIFKDD